jgi:hypothetical protein
MLRFIPQATLDSWMDEGKVDVRGDKLVEHATQLEFPVREAVHLIKVESGTDTQGWTEKVLSIEEVRGRGAEHYMTSVIAGETVYVVDPGWLAEEPDDSSAVLPARPAPAPRRGEPKGTDADVLAQLLLDKLS